VHKSPWPTLPFCISYLLPPLMIICVFARGWWSFVPAGMLLVALPLLDLLFGVASQGREAPDMAFNRYFRVVTWLWVPLEILLLAWVLREVHRGTLPLREMVGATLSMGLISGAIGVTFAHELIHRRYPWERALGHVLLLLVSYSHFAVHHIQGHHRWVATPRDPETARLNESFYRFLPRAVFGGFASAWTIERDRLTRHNKAILSFSNRIVSGISLAVILAFGLFVWGGWPPVIIFAGQGALAILVVEAINYIEHYGLVRREIGRGEYERVAPNHSWDSGYRVSSWLLINLPRHADQHCSANKR
jgi:alkane 1-monooxygenase